MNEIWPKRFLIVAAAWNILGGASALLDPQKHFAQLYTRSLAMSDPLQLFFFRCVWINVIAWGGATLLAAFRPASRGVVLLAGGLGKLAYCCACVALYRSGVGTSAVLTAGVVDLMLATVFLLLVFVWRPTVPAASASTG